MQAHDGYPKWRGAIEGWLPTHTGPCRQPSSGHRWSAAPQDLAPVRGLRCDGLPRLQRACPSAGLDGWQAVCPRFLEMSIAVSV
ncbi:hypothetical protein TI01_1020 [Lysobacter sp. A03]|nr:hypothetical protein TI01_1020 [Lysobacter sp. A03]